MRIMTFNLRCDFILDINNRWSNRKDMVINIIKKYKPDIIGVQELTNVMHRELVDALEDYYVVGTPRSKKIFVERNDIFIARDFHVEEYKTFWLSNTPQKISSSRWYSVFPRICTAAVIRDNNGNKYRICNSHLDFLFTKSRVYEVRKILSFIENEEDKEKLPTILMGDFNASPNSKVIEEIRKYNYNNKKFVAVQDYKKEIYNHTTMSRFKGRSKGIHIDYIFVTDNLSIKSTEILTYNENGKYPSDHYPLISEVE